LDGEPIFHPDVPEEIREQITTAHAFAAIATSQQHHEILDLIQSLSDDELKTLRFLITNVVNGGAAPGLFWLGFINAVLQLNHNLCLACDGPADHKGPQS